MLNSISRSISAVLIVSTPLKITAKSKIARRPVPKESANSQLTLISVWDRCNNYSVNAYQMPRHCPTRWIRSIIAMTAITRALLSSSNSSANKAYSINDV